LIFHIGYKVVTSYLFIASMKPSAYCKIILILLERTFVSLSLSILRDSSDFGTHLAYALILDTFILVLIIFVVDICVPWAVRARFSRGVTLSATLERGELLE